MGIKDTATGNSAPGLTGNTGFVIGVLVIVLFFDFFLNFGSFWFGRVMSQGRPTNLTRSMWSDVWPQFVREAEYYQNLDLMPTNFVIEKYLSLNRRAMGYGGPLIDYGYQKVLRLAALISYLTGGACVILFAFLEGFKKNVDKRLSFGRMSSTVYHISMKSVLAFSGSFMAIYLFLPGRILVPGIADMNLPVTAFNLPLAAAGIIILITVWLTYMAASNFSYKI